MLTEITGPMPLTLQRTKKRKKCLITESVVKRKQISKPGWQQLPRFIFSINFQTRAPTSRRKVASGLRHVQRLRPTPPFPVPQSAGPSFPNATLRHATPPEVPNSAWGAFTCLGLSRQWPLAEWTRMSSSWYWRAGCQGQWGTVKWCGLSGRCCCLKKGRAQLLSCRMSSN